MKPLNDDIVVRLVLWTSVGFENVLRVTAYTGIKHVINGYSSKWELAGNGAKVRSHEEVSKEVAATVCEVLDQVRGKG